MQHASHSLIIRGGRLLDPSSGRDEVADLAIAGETIAAIGPNLPTGQAVVLDVRGCYVLPGLIDGHVHVYDGVGEYGIAPDEIGVQAGVTTVIDGGSAGWATLDGFRRHVAERATTRVLACLHLSSVGLVMGNGGSELGARSLIDPEQVAEAIYHNRDLVIGLKVRAFHAALGDLGLEPIRLAGQVARAAGLPLVVHVGETSPLEHPPIPFPIAEVLDLLAPGDILAHVCTPRPGGLLDSNGRVHPAARNAAERGVRFDVAHGRYNFSFAVARRLAEQGIMPDIISTDISRGSRDGPVVDLPTTLSKHLALGFPLHQVVSMATRNVAGAFGLESTLGSVAVGRPADLSIVRLVEQPWDAVDSVGEVIRAPTMLEPLYAIRSGRPIGPLARDPA